MMHYKEIFRSGLKSIKGFTLIELLVVIAIIMILSGLLFPAFTRFRETGKRTKAYADVKQLDVAWRAVQSDYRVWSAVSVATGPSDMLAEKVNILAGPGNPKGVIYMEFSSNSLSTAGSTPGAFIDPWKNNYGICLGDGEVAPYAGVSLSREVCAWSRGKDGVDGTKDDIKSWE